MQYFRDFLDEDTVKLIVYEKNTYAQQRSFLEETSWISKFVSEGRRAYVILGFYQYF